MLSYVTYSNGKKEHLQQIDQSIGNFNMYSLVNILIVHAYMLILFHLLGFNHLKVHFGVWHLHSLALIRFGLTMVDSFAASSPASPAAFPIPEKVTTSHNQGQVL